LLYDSIFRKVLLLGDGVMVYRRTVRGSICGRDIASRDFSTIGFEKYYNPALQIKTKQGFIDYKMQEKHYMPPYFKEMEKPNLEKRQLRDRPKGNYRRFHTQNGHIQGSGWLSGVHVCMRSYRLSLMRPFKIKCFPHSLTGCFNCAN